jgi:TM2 domain-containing membrane protein YozV
MPHIITHYLPELDEPERSFIQRLTAGMSHENIQQFATAYRQVRKDPQTLRVMAIIGIVAIPGLYRFWVGHVGIGFLYLVTWGLLLFGTITDIVNYRQLAFDYNRQVARGIAHNLLYSTRALASGATESAHDAPESILTFRPESLLIITRIRSQSDHIFFIRTKGVALSIFHKPTDSSV